MASTALATTAAECSAWRWASAPAVTQIGAGRETCTLLDDDHLQHDHGRLAGDRYRVLRVSAFGFFKTAGATQGEWLLMLGTQATRYHRSTERKVLGRNVLADATAETDEDIPDPSKLFETTRKLSTMLVSRTAVLPVAAAALIPFAVAGATKLPYKEVFSVLKKLLLL
jgi:SLT domain-containing protein